MWERVRTLLYRLPLVQQLGIQLLVGLIIGLVCIGLFALLAGKVAEQDLLVRIDTALAIELHSQNTTDTVGLYRALSWMGQTGMWILGVLVGLFFLVRRQWLHLAVWAIAMLGATTFNDVLKDTFARVRPVFPDPFATEPTFGFPSGHAVMSTVGYGLLAYFLWHAVRSPIARILIVFVAVMLIVLTGISRLMLGVHYLSDVLAGFAVGGVWLSVCITAMDTIKRRKRAGDPAAQEPTGMQSSSAR